MDTHWDRLLFLGFIIIMLNHSDIELETLLKPQKAETQTPPFPVPFDNNEVFNEEVKEVVHTVAFGDTLQGLSLQYSCPPNKIRVRNNLTSDQIYFCKTLVIPDPQEPICRVDVEDEAEIRKKFMIISFRNQMELSDRSDKTAVFYLLEANWNMMDAFRLYKQDLQWEKKNKNKQPNDPYLREMKHMMEGEANSRKKKTQ